MLLNDAETAAAIWIKFVKEIADSMDSNLSCVAATIEFVSTSSQSSQIGNVDTGVLKKRHIFMTRRHIFDRPNKSAISV